MTRSIHEVAPIQFIPEDHGLLGTSENVSRETGTSNGPLIQQLSCQFLGGATGS